MSDQQSLELSTAEAGVVTSAGSWAITSAIVMTAFSVSTVVASGSELLAELIGITLVILSSALLFQAGWLFREVAAGGDRKHLVAGFAKLRAYFRLVVILVIIALGFALFTHAGAA